MALRTVTVPAAMVPLFERAEEVVSNYFSNRKDQPEQGTIEIFDERYLLVRAASLSVEFFDVVRDLLGGGREAEADEFSRNILFDLAHAMGKADARNFHEKMGLEDPVAKLSAGPVHFAHAGWAYVDISPRSNAVPGPDFYLLYDHPFSFESDAWLRADKRSASPACVMNAGYSSGWCEESFGVRLVAAEILCRAKGDDCCRFIMAPPARLQAHIEDYVAANPTTSPAGVHVVPDLFARKRLEDELREARDTLEQRVAERTEALRAANERLQEEIANRAHVERLLAQSQKLEALGRLAGGIAHDFNNLLSVMGGYAELLLAELPAADPAALFASEIAESVKRASGLTHQLLVFSRQRVATLRVVDVVHVVVRMEDLLRRLLGEDVTLVAELDDVPCHVRADPIQMEQVIINLAVNARDAMPDGGTLAIRVRSTGGSTPAGSSESDTVEIVVEDDGLGMDASALEHVFDPFFTTKKPGEGTGLGLAMVYGTITQYGGRIAVRSELGHGTRFEIQLPRIDGEPEPTGESRRRAPRSTKPSRLLVVEDDAHVRQLLVRSLERAGHELVVAESSEQAVELWNSTDPRPAALVTDVIMPGLPGSTLATTLRQDAPDLPVLFVSGYASDRVGQDVLADPNTAFVQKPFDLHELIARLDALL